MARPKLANPKQPLHSAYSVLFGISVVVIFLQLLDSIRSIFHSPVDFGTLGPQLMYFTLVGAGAGFFHHWSAYRDLGHIGLATDTLEGSLPCWVNTRTEFWLRVAALVFMLIAFSKGHVLVDLYYTVQRVLGGSGPPAIPCQLTDGICRPVANVSDTQEQGLFLAFGTLLALALLLWSIGAYRTRHSDTTLTTSIPEDELRWWIATDTLAFAFWTLSVLLLLLEMKGVAVALVIVAVAYTGVIVFRYLFRKSKRGGAGRFEKKRA